MLRTNGYAIDAFTTRRREYGGDADVDRRNRYTRPSAATATVGLTSVRRHSFRTGAWHGP